MRLTIQAGTTTTYNNSIETTKNIYVQNVDELMKEFEKQKSEFKNPNVTENEIMEFTEGVQDSKRIQKLGQYEDVDENPEHLADIKKALEIIEENLKYGYVFTGYGKDNKPLFQFADTKLYEEIKKNMTY